MSYVNAFFRQRENTVVFFCDSCKKKTTKPVTRQHRRGDCFYVRCESCRKELLAEVRQVVP